MAFAARPHAVGCPSLHLMQVPDGAPARVKEGEVPPADQVRQGGSTTAAAGRLAPRAAAGLACTPAAACLPARQQQLHGLCALCHLANHADQPRPSFLFIQHRTPSSPTCGTAAPGWTRPQRWSSPRVSGGAGRGILLASGAGPPPTLPRLWGPPCACSVGLCATCVHLPLCKLRLRLRPRPNFWHPPCNAPHSP